MSSTSTVYKAPSSIQATLCLRVTRRGSRRQRACSANASISPSPNDTSTHHAPPVLYGFVATGGAYSWWRMGDGEREGWGRASVAAVSIESRTSGAVAGSSRSAGSTERTTLPTPVAASFACLQKERQGRQREPGECARERKETRTSPYAARRRRAP